MTVTGPVLFCANTSRWRVLPLSLLASYPMKHLGPALVGSTMNKDFFYYFYLAVLPFFPGSGKRAASAHLALLRWACVARQLANDFTDGRTSWQASSRGLAQVGVSDEADFLMGIWHEDSQADKQQTTLADVLWSLSASFLTAFSVPLRMGVERKK